jgi:hypothetical protein
MQMRLVLAVVVAVLTTPGAAVWACSVSRIPDPRELVRTADMIVHAQAVDYADGNDIDERGMRLIKFDVVDTLKGPATRNLRIRGILSADDDYNDQRLPYTFVRPDGRRGDCFASTYRRGGQFLLMLKRVPDGYTPYWAALAPVNEQLRSDDDRWLAWVRQAVKQPATGAGEG